MFEKLVHWETLMFKGFKALWAAIAYALLVILAVEKGVFSPHQPLTALQGTLAVFIALSSIALVVSTVLVLCNLRKAIAWFRLSWRWGCYCRGVAQSATIEKYLGYLGPDTKIGKYFPANSQQARENS